MRFYKSVPMFLFAILCLGCQPDIYEISEEAPVISVKIIEQRNIVKENKSDFMVEDLIEIKFQLVADPAPKSDLLVSLNVPMYKFYPSEAPANYYPSEDGDSSGWTIIRTGETSSKVFTQTISVNSYRYVVVEPIPTISVVGEGDIVDTDELSENWGRRTLEGQSIPEGFRFPYYKVAEPSVTLYRPGKAKIISLDPPNESKFDYWDLYITVTFDQPPEFPKVNGTLLKKAIGEGDGTVFRINVPTHRIPPFDYNFTISWGDEVVGTKGEKKCHYRIY